ncbi:hypothetical protein Alsa2_CDS0029 [Staphylococcus phage Alsa_2]|nr:hypothetical protein Alsa2_CDS0029 [Staphylococcus phage Alsa_2]
MVKLEQVICVNKCTFNEQSLSKNLSKTGKPKS